VGKRLVGEGEPQGCLLHSSNPCGSQTHALIPSRGTWPVMCTMGIHQGNETSGHLPTNHRSPHGYLHRRHTPDGRISRAGDTLSRSTSLPADRARVHYQCTQVIDNPFQIKFLGLLVDSTTLQWRETPPHQVGSEPDPEERSGDSTPTGSNNRETACNIPSSPPSSLVLSFPSKGFTEGTEQQQSRLHCIHNPVPSSQVVVAGETHSMEWQGPGSPEGNSGDTVRCITAGMGSSVHWNQDWNQVEQEMHINCLELLAATLAVQTFLKDQTAVSVLL